MFITMSVGQFLALVIVPVWVLLSVAQEGQTPPLTNAAAEAAVRQKLDTQSKQTIIRDQTELQLKQIAQCRLTSRFIQEALNKDLDRQRALQFKDLAVTELAKCFKEHHIG